MIKTGLTYDQAKEELRNLPKDALEGWVLE